MPDTTACDVGEIAIELTAADAGAIMAKTGINATAKTGKSFFIGASMFVVSPCARCGATYAYHRANAQYSQDPQTGLLYE